MEVYILEGCQVCNDFERTEIMFFEPKVFTDFEEACKELKRKYQKRLFSGDVNSSDLKKDYFKIEFAMGEVIESCTINRVLINV